MGMPDDMKCTAVFTIASENYFAQVNTLLKSLKETNPDWDRFFALADEPDDDLIEALKDTDTQLIRMEEIGIPDLSDMTFRYDIMELNTAIKPFVILTLQQKYDRVVYLDPDICVYAEMKEVNHAFDKGYDFVVTPHFTDYFPNDGFHPDEPDIMRAGIYNFGFFAVSNSDDAQKAVRWWSERLETLCLNRQSEGIFVDQKWMDLLPGRHDKVCILRNNGYNTAYWNLSHRKASYRDGRYYINGDELVFFHYSGFDPSKPDMVSKHQNRYTINQIGVIKDLFYEYAKSVNGNDYNRWQKKKYAYSKFNDGRPINNIFRVLYRENESIEKKARKRNPFTCSDVFYNKKSQLAPILINHTINNHRDAGVFLINHKRDQWIDWFGEVLAKEYKMNEEWVKYGMHFFSKHLSSFSNDKINVRPYNFFEKIKIKEGIRSDGINLIGYIRSEHGVGEACRLTADALSHTSLEWNAYDWEMHNPSRQNDRAWDSKISATIKHNISIFNINADQLPVAHEHLPKEAWDGYRIGIWYWELTKFPVEWRDAFELVDEIWAPTRFIQENLERISPVPVLYMPPGLRREEAKREYNRAYFGLPENTFLFLNFFDAYSYTSRKNPIAAVKSFQMSFKPDDMSVGMVLKVNNAKNDDESLIPIRKLIGDYRNIYIISKIMTRDEMNALINVSDAAISLHRSEGLGLLCEESMYYGKPVIATNWSGNTDFMTAENACLVDYKMVPIGEYYGTNDAEQMWAEADISHASEYMRKLYSDHDYYKYISMNAMEHIRNEFSPEKCGIRMEKRINDILENKEQWEKRIEANDQLSASVESVTDTSSHNEDLVNLNTFYTVRFYRDLGTDRIKGFIKRVVRWFTAFILAPMSEEQTIFNASVTRLINELEADNASMKEKVFSELKEIRSGVEHSTQVSGSLYNAMYQRITSIDRTLSGEYGNGSTSLEKEFIENKWHLIDKYYREPDTMSCCICDTLILTASGEKLISEDIYGGGTLIRYRCPGCGAIIGPNKMWELSEDELSEEYKYHYRVNDEGQTTDAEIEVFMSLKPEKGKKYLNYGCGSWASTIEELRNQGYDVYGFDPYAPCDNKHIITDFSRLKEMKFDGIFSHDLLEHLRYPLDTFRLLNDILVTDGVMAHSTACYKYVYEYDRFHLVFYTGNSIDYLCKKTGFEIMEKHEDNDRLTYNYLYRKYS